MSIGHLMDWILTEYRKSGSIFGVQKIVRHDSGEAFPIFDEKIESVFGPAAGPNTQLAQNIIAAYAAGSRFFELKTVQKMDGAELSACVSKPCITAGDEGYNCEWSTELYVPQAYAEYVKAWVVCKLLAREFGLGDPDGFVFNMSVGYDLEGIKAEKVNTFIDDMKDAGNNAVFRECISWALGNTRLFRNVDEAFIRSISPRISASVTESTLHGCPPDEIERIATYLIKEKHLHTYIKCNPTLLGYDYARQKLDSLGFGYIAFDDHHFVEDLQWADAVPMIRRLQKAAAEEGLEFGVKLTNTFPVDVKASELPSEEMYMSGRSLFPLTIHLARLISEEFDGRLRISYSGGASIYNIRDLFEAGIWPVTMATNILKPGGYQRLSQIADELMDCGSGAFEGVDTAKVSALDESDSEGNLYRKPVKALPDRHIGRPIPLFDCFTAPCRSGCPIEQDIPAYLEAMAEGDAEKALKIIIERNALPFITGTICPHHCGDRCMRCYYEETLHIRETKLAAAEEAFDKVLPQLKSSGRAAGKKAAVIGGGPAGLSAAYFLSRAGIPVTVFERRNELGGVVRNVIPEFRIPGRAIDKDIELCKAYGAEFRTGTQIDSLQQLKDQGYSDIIVSIGAWKAGDAGLKYGETIDAIEFLEKAKNAPEELKPGRNVVVLGGGNTAMDAARAAVRIAGVEKVRLVYRRTVRYMPADEEELRMAIADGVEFMELLAPVGAEDGVLKCSVMKLGDIDASGRRSPVSTGNFMMIPADCIIAAVGEQIDRSLFDGMNIRTDAKGRPEVDENMMTSEAGIYAAGDSRRGPATVVEAVADASRAARAIAGISFDRYKDENAAGPEAEYRARKGLQSRDLTAVPDERCLGCAAVCEVCADVCPNRANVSVRVPGMSRAQIIHVDGMCNECGNCAVFCPYSGRPYRDKFTLFWSSEDFDSSENEGFLVMDDGRIRLRLGGEVKCCDINDPALPADAAAVIRTVVQDYPYLIK